MEKQQQQLSQALLTCNQQVTAIEGGGGGRERGTAGSEVNDTTSCAEAGKLQSLNMDNS